jgi:hypothetical protein
MVERLKASSCRAISTVQKVHKKALTVQCKTSSSSNTDNPRLNSTEGLKFIFQEMVRLYGIVIAKKNGDKIQKLCEEIDVSSFGFFQRNSVGEFVKFTHSIVLGNQIISKLGSQYFKNERH